MEPEEKHAFISYVRENSAEVDRLCRVLEAAKIPYWRDRESLGPGDLWQKKIREAIQADSMVFLACFSDQSRAKDRSVMNEELWLAAQEFRLRPPGRKYLFPIRFDAGEVPDWELGGNLTLRDVQYTDLFGGDYEVHAVELVEAIKSAMGRSSLDPATVRTGDQGCAEQRPLQFVMELIWLLIAGLASSSAIPTPPRLTSSWRHNAKRPRTICVYGANGGTEQKLGNTVPTNLLSW